MGELNATFAQRPKPCCNVLVGIGPQRYVEDGAMDAPRGTRGLHCTRACVERVSNGDSSCGSICHRKANRTDAVWQEGAEKDILCIGTTCSRAVAHEEGVVHGFWRLSMTRVRGTPGERQYQTGAAADDERKIAQEEVQQSPRSRKHVVACRI